MMRTRRGAAALLVLLILPWQGCSVRKGMASLVVSSSIGAFPKESVALLVVEVGKIRALRPDAPWLRPASLAEGAGPIAAIVGRLGPEFLAHVERLSVAVVPQPGGPVGYGVLAEGKFDPAQMRAAIGDDLTTLVETEKMDLSVTRLGEGGIALGPRRVLQTMRANHASHGHGLDANPIILGSLEKVRAEAQLWGAFDCPSLQRLYREAAGAPEVAGLSIDSAPVQSLQTIALRGMVGDPARLDLYGQANSEANARTLADAARGLVALGRVGASRDQAKEWLDLLDGIQIRQNGASIDLSAAIPAGTMDAFVSQVMSSRPPAPEASPRAVPEASRTPRSPAAPEDPGRPLPPPAGHRPKPEPRESVAPPAPPEAPPAPGSGPPADSSRPPAPRSQGTPGPSDGAP